MWKNAYVGVYQLLNWKMHGETLKSMYNCWSGSVSLNTYTTKYNIAVMKTYMTKIMVCFL